MPEYPNRLSQFLQELKRRKVIKVVAMYAATAFIIIEAADIVLPRLGLPDWTVTFLIVLIIVGFPLTVILSWIFDVTPEGIRKTESIEEISIQEPEPSPQTKGRRKLRISDGIIAALFVAVCVLLYPKIFRADKFKEIRDEDGRISVAVMPFQNMTNDTLLDIWQAGIQNELITGLSNSEELSVRQFETTLDILQGKEITNYATLSPSIAGDLSRKLNASTFVNGTIKTAGNKIRINTQLVDSQTEEIYKTYQVDGDSETVILLLTDSLTGMIKNFLQIRVLEKSVKPDMQNISAKSAEAYRHFILGMESEYAGDNRSAIGYFKKAIEADHSFISAYIGLIRTSFNQELYKEGKKWLNIAMDYYDDLPILLQFKLDDYVATIKKDLQEAIRVKKQIVELEPNSRRDWHSLGWAYDELHQYQNAIEAYEKALEIDRQWGGGWKWPFPYMQLGRDYHRIGNHKKENEIYAMGLEANPDSWIIYYNMGICALSQGDSSKLKSYFDKTVELVKETGATDIQIINGIAQFYEEAMVFDKAEEYYRQALKMEPKNIGNMQELAWLLIDKEIDVDEGMELIEPVLDQSPDEPRAVETWGWGLYKQGKLEESLEFLKRSWDLLPTYDHDNYLRIQKVEQALTSRDQ